MSTIFFRLLAHENKGIALSRVIESVNGADCTPPDTYISDPQSFSQIPGSPFAYWVSEHIRGKFESDEKFESGGRAVRHGLVTTDDFRFVRAWWEAAPERIGSTQESTGRGKDWVLLAKGGEYSPYYADIHVVVDWGNNGERLKRFVEQRTRGSFGTASWSRWINSWEYYFLPGLTWPLRGSRFAPMALPGGCIFSARGYAVLAPAATLPAVLGLGASSTFDYLFKTMLGRFGFPEFIVGVLQQMPVPRLDSKEGARLARAALSCTALKRSLDTATGTSHAFVTPALLQVTGNTVADRASGWRAKVAEADEQLAANQAEIDEIAYRLYDISDEDRRAIEASLRVPRQNAPAEENEEEPGGEKAESEEPAADSPHLVAALLSYAVGCAFGRWDVRVGIDPTLAPRLADLFAPLPVCSPGALVGADGLPARPGGIVSEEWLRARPDAITLPPEGSVRRPTIPDEEYPLRVSWDGLLVDDPDHQDDAVRRVREVLGVLWRERAEAIEAEARGILGVGDLRDYFARPGSFFADHLKRYSKSRRQAPLYWPLSTTSGSYTLWVYYHRLTSDTLYSAVNRYVAPKIEQTRRRLGDLEAGLAGASGREAAGARSRIEESRAFLSELEEFRRELMRVAALPYRPDLNDGVIINAAPLHRLFRLPKWAKDTKECWEKLQKGDYDWAHLAYVLRPERVREKCKSDRSLAIAHGLQDLYAEPPSSVKKRGKRAARMTEEDDEAVERQPSWPPEGVS